MTIGETLRGAREAKGFSVQDVQTATRMTARQVTDMENDDFSSFAYPFYAKVFLRQFARAVGLDPAPLVAQWAAESGGTAVSEERRPVVPLETIDEESGGVRVVKPEIPGDASGQQSGRSPERKQDRPVKRAVPAPEPPPRDDSPRPEKRVAAADPAVAAAAADAAEKVPPPEKRVAAVQPGDVAPEPVSLRAPEAVAAREVRPVRDLPPVVKKIPSDFETASEEASTVAPAAVPDFIESAAPAFVFPGASAPEPDDPEVSEAPQLPAVPETPRPPAKREKPASKEADLPLFSLQPESVAATAPVPEPAAPAPAPEPVPAPVPAPVHAPEPVPAPIPAPTPVPAPAPVPAPFHATVSAPAPAPLPVKPPVRKSAPAAVAVEPLEDDDSAFGTGRSRRIGALAAVSALFSRKRGGEDSAARHDPFGAADIFSDVPKQSRRIPLPGRPAMIAGGAVAAVLVVAGAVAAFRGSSTETAPEDDGFDPVVESGGSAAAAEIAETAETAASPVSAGSATEAPVAAPQTADAAPLPPVYPTAVLPPPRSFAR